MRGSSLVVPLNLLQNGEEGGCCSNERAPEASGALDTQYLDGFEGGTEGGASPFLLSIQNFFFFLRVGLRHSHFSRNRLTSVEFGFILCSSCLSSSV